MWDKNKCNIQILKAHLLSLVAKLKNVLRHIGALFIITMQHQHQWFTIDYFFPQQKWRDFSLHISKQTQSSISKFNICV